ncbi:2-succinyl-6-hydroxy-2,4-cyclohexadiene-1-carboxylate synthase [Halobacillus sp. Cin3]|uniref:2-succinyl-6-hydroxy-2, 4-cyclohexadiene-1-carboxylate synthase n=1 Tax=Halobacillus sp. Cin3 TaxID=2928441 RepID=UPI00248EBBE0|nr:2-succinyl-6-hydroxy-2,4-cyclohexadiene-1-carboxylate synthase [Halobacillus sp. Cin3]
MNSNINGRQYGVERTGRGEPLLLLHGFTGTSGTFDEVLSYVTGSYDIVKVDLPGHGNTGPLGTISMERFCRDLHVLLDRLEIEQVHLLGYSLGGRAALSFAMLYPHKVKSVLLESASPGLASTEEQLARQAKDKALADMLLREGLHAFVDYWEQIPLFRTQERLPEVRKQQIRSERLSQQKQGLAESLSGMGTGHQPSWWEQLTTLTVPVWLITGVEDEKFQNINKQMSELLPQVHWEEVEGAGHAVHLEKPRIFAKIVDSFMLK